MRERIPRRAVAPRLTLVLLLLLALVGCGPEPSPVPSPTPSLSLMPEPSPSESQATNSPQMPETAYTPLRFYELLDLEEGDKVAVFDVEGDQVLFSVYRNYEVDDPRYSELGYSSYTLRAGVYSLERQAILRDIPVGGEGDTEDENLYTDGALSNGRIALVKVRTAAEAAAGWEIEVWDGSARAVPAKSRAVNISESVPSVRSLEEGFFAYSYHSYEDGSFGLDLISADNEVSPLLAYTQGEGTGNLDTYFSAIEGRFSYWALVEGQVVTFVGDRTGVLSQVPMAEDERHYTFIPVGDRLLFSSERSSPRLFLRDMEGNTLADRSGGPYFRMASNGKDLVLCIDMSYQPYLIWAEDEIWVWELEEAEAEPALFYSVDENRFLMHYEGMGLVMLELS